MEKIALFGKAKPLLNYLSSLTEFKGFEKFSFIFPESFLEVPPSVGIIVEYPNENVLSNLESFPDSPVLILYSSKNLSESELENLKNICKRDSNIKGLIDSEVSLTFHLPIFREAFLGIEPKKILGDLLTRSLIELERIKEIHRKMVPIRSGSNNGINYFSKFASGESPGGEFFNFNNKNLENMFFFSNADSYLTSNLVLSAYEKFDFEEFNLNNFKKFIESIEADKLDLSKNKLELLMASIDRKNLTIEGYNFSSCRIFLSDEIKMPSTILNSIPPENLKDSYFSFKIGRGERLYIFSSGYIRNMEKYYPDFEISSLLKKVNKLPAGDALNEFFFQLKRKVVGKFPFYDSSIIIIEVDKNVLFQV